MLLLSKYFVSLQLKVLWTDSFLRSRIENFRPFILQYTATLNVLLSGPKTLVRLVHNHSKTVEGLVLELNLPNKRLKYPSFWIDIDDLLKYLKLQFVKIIFLPQKIVTEKLLLVMCYRIILDHSDSALTVVHSTQNRYTATNPPNQPAN